MSALLSKMSSLIRHDLVAWLRRLVRTHKRRGKLRKADVVIVSHAKSGRTWLLAMISNVYHRLYGLDERELLLDDSFHRINPAVPIVFLTHDNQGGRAKKPLAPARAFVGKKVILLVRDPRDIAVSAFFQWRRNVRKGPDHQPPDAGTMFRYVTTEKLPQVVAFQRRWRRNLESIEQALLVRYEDLRARPEAELARIMAFIGTDTPPETIADAVRFASFESLKAKEAEGFFTSDRLRPGDGHDPQSFKVRSGRVGGYAEHFTPAELAEIERLIDAPAVASFGYRPQPSVETAGPGLRAI